MIDVPLRSISIADFRRLEGHRTLPLDAPIVLLHGSNGTGKTSVLSALELALTGEIRSMRRHDPRYTAHLPFHGQDFATLRATVSDRLSASARPETMTVGGSRIEGSPALGVEAARFYAERCYLDQVSLGQLLELYQYREGKEESALTRFVNELLGLEQLDALWTGLSDSTDLRRLRKLSEPLAEGEVEAQRAADDLSQATATLTALQNETSRARASLAAALSTLQIEMPSIEDETFGPQVADLLRAAQTLSDRSSALDLTRSLTKLDGRIEALSIQPAAKRLEEAAATLSQVTERYEAWRDEYAPKIDDWRREAAQLQFEVAENYASDLDTELERVVVAMSRQADISLARGRLEEQLTKSRTALDATEALLAAVQEQAGSLVEGLSLLREHATANTCPVCDRDFSEVSSTHLTVHMGRKIAELTSQGARIRELREQRDALASEFRGTERQLIQLEGELWSEAQREAIHQRRADLESLRESLRMLQPAIHAGVELQQELSAASTRLEQLQSSALESATIRSNLVGVATQLGVAAPDPAEPLRDAWRRYSDIAAGQLAQLETRRQAHAVAVEYVDQLRQLSGSAAQLKDVLSEAAERKLMWDTRIREVRRRQTVARSVQSASSTARAAIIQRVFTKSLNRVWRDVFTRLAPREPFVPAFGVPSSSRAGLELRVETVHRSGLVGGSPQMMLSAGNLNTAALSLFIALHLAVDPLVPCLVLDDPVQSMDEVHIAQFAALIRVLAKSHQRQVVIAVHERELFQYLALELSPAFPGDQLLTIELGERPSDDGSAINRLTWSPDSAIAG